MRAAAIVANLVQMVIVLSIFLLQGISLGGWTILALFILLIIACANLLVLLFAENTDQGLIANAKKALTKRKDLRVSYASGLQPTLNFGGRKYDIMDIAESGARIVVGRRERLKKRVKSHVQLLCGESLTIKTVVIRREGDEVALAFKPPIEYSILLKERQALANS